MSMTISSGNRNVSVGSSGPSTEHGNGNNAPSSTTTAPPAARSASHQSRWADVVSPPIPNTLNDSLPPGSSNDYLFPMNIFPCTRERAHWEVKLVQEHHLEKGTSRHFLKPLKRSKKVEELCNFETRPPS